MSWPTIATRCLRKRFPERCNFFYALPLYRITTRLARADVNEEPGTIGVGTVGTKKKAAEPPSEQSECEHLDALLDEALEETFPASDPVAIEIEKVELSRSEKTKKK